MNNKIQYILAGKNITGIANVDYTLLDNSDGNGAFISNWNEFKLGLQPGYAQLDALDSDPAFATYLSNKTWGDIRVIRGKLLGETDWTQLGDSQLSPAVQASWLTYRQALRDVTTQADPTSIVWPTKPV